MDGLSNRDRFFARVDHGVQVILMAVSRAKLPAPRQLAKQKVGIAGKAIVISSQGAVTVVCGNASPSAHII